MKFDKEKFAQLQEERRLHFARFCWVNRRKMAPSGKGTWGDIFYQKEGLTLDEFKLQQEQKK